MQAAFFSQLAMKGLGSPLAAILEEMAGVLGLSAPYK